MSIFNFAHLLSSEKDPQIIDSIMVSSIHIREARLEDVKAISLLIQANTDQVLTNNYTDEQKEVWKAANTFEAIKQNLTERRIFCAFKADKMLGTIGLKGNELVGLYVHPEALGMGIGKKLLIRLEEEALKANISTLELCATPAGKGFYEHFGYKVEGPVVVKIQGVNFFETQMIKNLGNGKSKH